MKRTISVILLSALILSGCANAYPETAHDRNQNNDVQPSMTEDMVSMAENTEPTVLESTSESVEASKGDTSKYLEDEDGFIYIQMKTGVREHWLLSHYEVDGHIYDIEYDENGYRSVKKKDGEVVASYQCEEIDPDTETWKLTSVQMGDERIDYQWDIERLEAIVSPLYVLTGFEYREDFYAFDYDETGQYIIGILDGVGNTVVEYVYDGIRIANIKYTDETLARLNVMAGSANTWDEETGFYYEPNSGCMAPNGEQYSTLPGKATKIFEQ